jgi:trans-aconitate 2-methyltransferase
VSPAGNGDWDAATYDRISDPMLAMGIKVLDRLELRGHERVLDAGCGSGRVTELLLERVPDGHVVALDASPAMVEEARGRLARFDGRVSFVCADLGQPLPVDPRVDALLSTATFHWVPDHDAMFANLAAVMRPGAHIEAQFGGEGNIANVIEAVHAVHGPASWDVHFESANDTGRRMKAAGFTDVNAWLQPEVVELGPGEPLETYLATIVLRTQIAPLPEHERATYIHLVAEAMREPVIRYVRLNISARQRD